MNQDHQSDSSLIVNVLGNDRVEYGKEIVQTLSAQLTKECGNFFQTSRLSLHSRDNWNGHISKNHHPNINLNLP